MSAVTLSGVVSPELDAADRLAAAPAPTDPKKHVGVRGEAWDLIDEVVEIPMIGQGASLNVAVAEFLAVYRTRSGDQLECHTVARAHDAEVAMVDRGQGAQRQALSHGDHAGVDQSEVEIGVADNQLGAAGPVLRHEIDQRQIAGGDRAHESRFGRRTQPRTDHPGGFGGYRSREQQLLAMTIGEQIGRSLVPAIISIGRSDEHAGVDNDAASRTHPPAERRCSASFSGSSAPSVGRSTTSGLSATKM